MCSACSGDYEDPEMTQEPEMVDEKSPWFQVEDRWTVEASLLSEDEYPKCPVCGLSVLQEEMKLNKFPSGEPLSWEGVHRCGTKLVIFND